MKAGENWLREWINPSLSTQALADQLTMAGLEIESLTPMDNTTILEVNVTPNRGDCLSVLGLAREVALLNQQSIKCPKIDPIVPSISDKISIKIKAPSDCPRYVGRIIKGIHRSQTPSYIAKILQHCDINLIHPVVDILNFVMLELGQPMHAFDADKLKGDITVRVAKEGEEIVVLGEQKVKLVENALVIADEQGPQAIAGIMGGESSAVTEGTVNIFLESALFTMERIAGKARQMGLHTDSSHRFERGVDPELQQKAMERATRLILDHCGGEAGPIVECVEANHLPQKKTIKFRPSRFTRMIGNEISEERIKKIFEQLECQIFIGKTEWEVTPASFRYDLNEEIDLIEEIARVVGYSEIKATHTVAEFSFDSSSQTSVSGGAN